MALSYFQGNCTHQLVHLVVRVLVHACPVRRLQRNSREALALVRGDLAVSLRLASLLVHLVFRGAVLIHLTGAISSVRLLRGRQLARMLVLLLLILVLILRTLDCGPNNGSFLLRLGLHFSGKGPLPTFSILGGT